MFQQNRIYWAAALTLLTAAAAVAQSGSNVPLPKVVLLGDSIRLGYAPLVAKRLAGRVEVLSVPENGGDSSNVLQHLDEWVIKHQPLVVHLNCGLHDLKLDRASKRHQVPVAQYRENLTRIVERVRSETRARLVFANTTPIHDERHASRRAAFDRTEADVRRYNAAAAEVLLPQDVPIHDLHWVVEEGGRDRLLLRDGTHYTPDGYARLAEAVADSVVRHLTLAAPRTLPAAASGADAGAKYREEETRRDALVPERYRRLSVPEFHPPNSVATWNRQRAEVRSRVLESLGDLPPRPDPRRARIVSREQHRGFRVERIALENGVDGEVTALVLVPDHVKGKAPAVLWLHSSTPDKNQILAANTFWGTEPLGAVLARSGYVVLSPDAYWHGDRLGTGPAGPAESLRDEQESLFKFHLWQGRTLWGMFVRDDQIALDYLCSRPEVDARRIGATGMSMGSTRAWWLAAVDERISATVAIACMTRYQNLIRHGQLRAHGIYYFASGLLKHFDSEAVVALVAPRPLLILTGDLDAGSPADGIREIEARVTPVYRTLGAADRFENHLYRDVGHTVSPEMRRKMLLWFERWLGQPIRDPQSP